MNNFRSCLDIGAKGIKDLLPFLNTKAYGGRFVLTDKGNLSEFLQKTVGDIIFNCPNGKVWTIEVKTELESKYGNFYLETWSNLSRLTPGWMVTLVSDFLWYYFQDIQTLYSIQLPKLQDWAFRQRHIYGHPEKIQKKAIQMNDTWGRCVPIKVIKEEVGFNVYNVEPEPEFLF
jgi:hypothetical protein